MNPRRAGFTLIELMVVVALIAIMLAIAAPNFTSFISNYRVTSAMNDFLQGVTLTRNEAIKRGRRVLMLPRDALGVPNPNGDWKNGWAVFVHAGAPPIGYNLADPILFQHDPLPVSIAITNAGGGPAKPFTDASAQTYVSFDGTGYPRQSTGGVLTGGIVMTDTTGSSVNIRTMCLATLGRPRIVKGLDTCASG